MQQSTAIDPVINRSSFNSQETFVKFYDCVNGTQPASRAHFSC